MRHEKYRADHARGEPDGRDCSAKESLIKEYLVEEALGNEQSVVEVVDSNDQQLENENAIDTVATQATQAISDNHLRRFEHRLGRIASLMKGELKSRCPEISERVGKYTLLSLLCSRGPSFVFQAIDEQLNRLVVIKIYRNGRTESARESLLNEARTMSRVNSRYVAKCIDISDHQGLPFMVLEHVSGIDLAQFIATHDVSIELALNLMTQIAQGMQDVHAKGILHLDLKPSNVLLLPNGEIKIIDFGLAQPMQELKRDNRSGTIAYMPPERAKNKIGLVGPASDVFGLGTIFYSLLTGRAPFDANSKPGIYKKAVAGAIVPPRHLVRGIPKSVDRLCMQCLEQNVFDRFGSAESFLRATNAEVTRRERNRVCKRFSYAVSLGIAATVAVLLCVPSSQPNLPGYDSAPTSYVVHRSGKVIPEIPNGISPGGPSNFYSTPRRTSTRSR